MAADDGTWDVDVIAFGTINGTRVNGMRWRIRLLEHGAELAVGNADSPETGTTIRYSGDDVRERTERTITQMHAASANRPSDAERDLALETFPTTQLTSMRGGRCSDRSDPAASRSRLVQDQDQARSG